jgi:hypothetical protein
VKLIGQRTGLEKNALQKRVARLRRLYTAMSGTYQASKGAGEIPLA